MYICTFVFSPPVRGFLHILTCTCNYMLWPLALREYNLSIPNNGYREYGATKNSMVLSINYAIYSVISYS
jgi:hypothetical protein